MTENTISYALNDIHQRIIRAAQKAQRVESEISLVAVSKFHPLESIEKALHAGQRIFGENRVQEAAHKFPLLRAQWPDLKLHLIGGLQTNKATDACRIADVIESLDRPSLSDALDKGSQKVGRLPDLLIQVNTGDEPQKFGISLHNADSFIEESMKRFGPSVKGLMVIPPHNENPLVHFRILAQLSRRHGLSTLSMGMSADFEDAILEGATLVRVGSAIFGHRPSISPDKTT